MPIQNSTIADLFIEQAFAEQLETGGNPVSIFRNILTQGKETLQSRFDQGDDIELIVQDNALLIDEILKRAWQYSFKQNGLQAALIAVGGYGRRELHPGSDIDLLLLFEVDDIENHKSDIESFLTLLWDIGLEVGQSVRTIDDCVNEAKQDVTVITNLIESRFLTGARDLFEHMLEATATDRIWPSNLFFEAKVEEQKKRYLRYDDSAYKLEPNIKESPGGLRDIQTIAWVAKRHFGARNLHELVAYDFLDEEEYQTLRQGQKLLWKIRFALHSLTKRREDRLLFDYQKTLAIQFGYDDDGYNLAVEQFMQQYYRTVMELDRLNEMLLQHFQEAILYADDSAVPVALNSRFQTTKGFIEVTHENTFKHYPYALLEVFLLLQLHPQLKGVRASTIRLIRASQNLINDEVRNDLRTKSIFMEILRQPHGITHELRRMNRYGILAAYLPAFANIVGRMQYDLFHNYTVDEHILFVVRNLRRFTVPKYHKEFPLCSDIMSTLAKPELLYMAGLYHDIAKGRGGDHSELGEEEAIRLCESHGLGDYDTRLVAWLVRHHLIMSMTAQRKDISDPEVIQIFADAVGDQTHLDYIYLLTVADIRGTSPELWNSWKDSLLKELYHATKKALRTSSHVLTNHDQIMESKKQDTLEQLGNTGITRETIEYLWSRFPQEYFIQYTSEEMTWHIQSISKADKNTQPLICVRQDKARGSTAIFIYGPAKLHQFATTTACLEKIGLNVVDARIISSVDEYTLDTYLVLEQNNKTIHDNPRLNEIRSALQMALSEDIKTDNTVNRRLPRQHKHFNVETKVRFSLDKSNQRTVLEVTTADRPGLLSRIGEAFKECKVNLQNAKIATIGMRIEDVFYITNRDHQPLDDKQFEKLRHSLLEKLGD